MSKAQQNQLSDYPISIPIDTRWHDNDIYGHVNNVVYYSYFDSLVNRFLIEHAGLDIHHGQQIGLMVSSQCNYFDSVAFPDALIGGLRVTRLGNSSVEYDLAIFKQGQQSASAQGRLTHVFVDRHTQKPKAIEGRLRETLQSIMIQTDAEQ